MQKQKKMPRKRQMTHPNLLSTFGAITRLLIEGVVESVPASAVFIPRKPGTRTTSEISPGVPRVVAVHPVIQSLLGDSLKEKEGIPVHHSGVWGNTLESGEHRWSGIGKGSAIRWGILLELLAVGGQVLIHCWGLRGRQLPRLGLWE